MTNPSLFTANLNNLVALTTGKCNIFPCDVVEEWGPYVKTAGTVILGWLIVSWIWHIMIICFAPTVVSALAIFLICPTTVEWFVGQIGPSCLQKTVHSIAGSLGLINCRMKPVEDPESNDEEDDEAPNNY